jgi:hypothetical protein
MINNDKNIISQNPAKTNNPSKLHDNPVETTDLFKANKSEDVSDHTKPLATEIKEITPHRSTAQTLQPRPLTNITNVHHNKQLSSIKTQFIVKMVLITFLLASVVAYIPVLTALGIATAPLGFGITIVVIASLTLIGAGLKLIENYNDAKSLIKNNRTQAKKPFFFSLLNVAIPHYENKRKRAHN